MNCSICDSLTKIEVKQSIVCVDDRKKRNKSKQNITTIAFTKKKQQQQQEKRVHIHTHICMCTYDGHRNSMHGATKYI